MKKITKQVPTASPDDIIDRRVDPDNSEGNYCYCEGDEEPKTA